VDAEGGTARTNEAYRQMFGAKALIALDNSSNVLPPDDSPQARASRGESFDMEFTAIAADSTHRRFEATGRPVRGGQDDGRGGVIIIREAGEYQRQE
jgi:two-component system, chemotaxis family, CheB/CheR fusion protein